MKLSFGSSIFRFSKRALKHRDSIFTHARKADCVFGGFSFFSGRRQSFSKVGSEGEGGRFEFETLMKKSLDQVLVKELVDDKSSDEIKVIWENFFEDNERSATSKFPYSYGKVLENNEWEIISNRLKYCKNFICPVFNPNKDAGGYYMLFSHWEDDRLVLTYLEDFKNNPETAQPYMSVQPFLDYKDSKAIVLIYCEFLPQLSKEEVASVLKQIMQFYTEDKKFFQVETFNLAPERFSFEKAFNL